MQLILFSLRIPIGFWAFDNSNTSYIFGAAAYLDKALEWARAADMLVWVDLHGHPGSQNGFDNSGQKGDCLWQQGDNMDRSTAVLKTMATKYGSTKYSDVVAGIELVNEPINYGNNDFNVTRDWAVTAYNTVREAATNKNLQIITHDSFENATKWFGEGQKLNAIQSNFSLNSSANFLEEEFYGFALDTHLYQLYVDSDNELNQAGHIAKACAWRDDTLLLAQRSGLPIYAGEWTATTNVCVNPDGSTIAGQSTADDCKEDGCQCVVDTNPTKWSSATKAQVKKFIEAQLSSFEIASSGYFVWSFKGPGTWSFMDGVEQGWFPKLDGDFEDACS